MSKEARLRITTLLICVLTTTAPALLAQQLPSPESVLGHRPGDDFFLATYDESLQYFKQLEQSTDKLRLVNVGQTSNGLEWQIALISSSENLARIDRYKQIAGQLAWARDLAPGQARALAQEGRVIVHIDGGLHATEVAHAQHTIQLAYDLVSAEGDPQIDRILDQVILMLWFSINPDGQNMVANWYRRNLGTPFEVSGLPWLYQKYVGHDNNRDGYMNNMLESQVVTRTTLEYSPQVFYNHHQSSPFPTRIWIPPFAEPVSRNTHALMWRWVNLLGTNMAAYLDERGMPGAVHRGQGFDDWYPGFIDHVNNFRNTISFLTETALYRFATPHFYTVNDFPANRRDLRPDAFYSSPWKGGWWRLGDAVRYMLGASMSVLDLASKYRENIQFNRFQAGQDVIQRFRREPPYAWILPADQEDSATAAVLAQKMSLNGIEVHQTTSGFSAGGRVYAAGSWVILMDQPFAALVKELFEVQVYPDLRDFPDGPPDLPYDVAGWTLPLQMGVEAIPLLSSVDAQARSSFRRLDEVLLPGGQLSGSGSTFLIDNRSNAATRVVNEALKAGATAAFSASEKAIVLEGIGRQQLERLLDNYGAKARAVTSQPESAIPFSRPRVGLYRPWTASIDEGWTRWLLEDFGFDPISLYNGDLQAGRLRERLDVIVFADGRSRSFLTGNRSGTIPEEFAGGIGDFGLENLQEFVNLGGSLLAFNNASGFAIDTFQLPVKNVLAGLSNQEFFCSGSILKSTVVAADHPIANGLPAEPNLMFERGPTFKPEASFKGTSILSYPDRNPLMSGFILKPEKIQKQTALLEARLGEGRIVLFGFRPQWRGQSHGSYRLIFNSLFLSTVPAAETDEGDDQQAQNFQLDTWNGIRSSIRAELTKFIQENRDFNTARGSAALAAANRLEALVDSFSKQQLNALQDLQKTVAPDVRTSLSQYVSQLKGLLVDVKSKDFSSVDYSVSDLVRQYRLDELEGEVRSKLIR